MRKKKKCYHNWEGVKDDLTGISKDKYQEYHSKRKCKKCKMKLFDFIEANEKMLGIDLEEKENVIVIDKQYGGRDWSHEDDK